MRFTDNSKKKYTKTQLACLSGSNGQQQKAQGGYVRHILAGSPKRSHFSSSRRQIGNGHVSEISSSASGVNGTAKKRVSFAIFNVGTLNKLINLFL